MQTVRQRVVQEDKQAHDTNLELYWDEQENQCRHANLQQVWEVEMLNWKVCHWSVAPSSHRQTASFYPDEVDAGIFVRENTKPHPFMSFML